MDVTLNGLTVVAGTVRAPLLASTEPLSFWGGYDPLTGEILDRRHPLSGLNAAHQVLAVPVTRGSSTSTAVILEAIRRGTAPAAVVTTGVDTFIALAAIVANEMWNTALPIVALSTEDFQRLPSSGFVAVHPDGRLTVSTRAPHHIDPNDSTS